MALHTAAPADAAATAAAAAASVPWLDGAGQYVDPIPLDVRCREWLESGRRLAEIDEKMADSDAGGERARRASIRSEAGAAAAPPLSVVVVVPAAASAGAAAAAATTTDGTTSAAGETPPEWVTSAVARGPYEDAALTRMRARVPVLLWLVAAVMCGIPLVLLATGPVPVREGSGDLGVWIAMLLLFFMPSCVLVISGCVLHARCQSPCCEYSQSGSMERVHRIAVVFWLIAMIVWFGVTVELIMLPILLGARDTALGVTGTSGYVVLTISWFVVLSWTAHTVFTWAIVEERARTPAVVPRTSVLVTGSLRVMPTLYLHVVPNWAAIVRRCRAVCGCAK